MLSELDVTNPVEFVAGIVERHFVQQSCINISFNKAVPYSCTTPLYHPLAYYITLWTGIVDFDLYLHF